MEYEFKNLNEIEMLDKPTENTTVMASEDGHPKQISASEFGRNVIVIDLDDENIYNEDTNECSINYDPIYETLESGGTVILKYQYNDTDLGLISFSEPVLFWTLIPNSLCVSTYNVYRLIFPNGSYHTATEGI